MVEARDVVREILRSRTVWARRRDAPPDDAEPTPRLCWHCCHAIEGEALRFPVRHDERRNAFKVVGQFCSWPCIKAYNRDTHGLRSSVNDVTIRYYYKATTGRTDRVPSAPPRVALKAFGGHMTIEQFRGRHAHGGSDPHAAPHAAPPHAIPLPVHFLSPFAMARDPRRDEAPPAKRRAVVPDGPLDFADVDRARDSLQLRRPKPLAVGQNALERALGLNSLIKR